MRDLRPEIEALEKRIAPDLLTDIYLTDWANPAQSANPEGPAGN